MAKYLPETKGLTLEEIATKFGAEVAVDITHLSLEQKAVLDKKLADIDGTPSEGSPPNEKVHEVHEREKV